MREVADRPSRRKVLVACLGNADRGDDAVGPIVAQKLRGRVPVDVPVLVRGGDMLSLIEDWSGYDSLICVDAAGPIGAPGRIYRLDLATDVLPRASLVASSHALSLAEVIDLARILRCAPQHIIVYAVEGSRFDAGAAITAAAVAAADEVASCVVAEVRQLLQNRAEPVSHA